MSLATQLSEDTVSDRDTHWEAQQRCFEARLAALLREQQVLEEREVYAQERVHLWQDLQVKRQRRDGQGQELPLIQERLKLSQEHLDELRHLRHSFQEYQEAYQDKLSILRERRRALRDISDLRQRQHAFRELQVEYLHLQQELREQQHLLREQRERYYQLRLDYQQAHVLLRAEKSVMAQRQEARRWQGYGYLCMGSETPFVSSLHFPI
jgi:hypothetical protein